MILGLSVATAIVGVHRGVPGTTTIKTCSSREVLSRLYKAKAVSELEIIASWWRKRSREGVCLEDETDLRAVVCGAGML